MNAVGIDVSKGKSMVAIMRSLGEIVYAPFEVQHTDSDIQDLIEKIRSLEGETRIVMEHAMDFNLQVWITPQTRD